MTFKKRMFTATMIVLLLASTLTLAFNVQPVTASGTIYIRANGSIEGTTNIWTADNTTYFFNATIHDSIIVERNNIILDGNGYRLQGAGNGTGISLSTRNNVTIKNTIIIGWGSVFDPSATIDSERWVWGIAISIDNSRSINIINNTVSNNCIGIFLTNSNSSNIIGNLASSNSVGIYLNGYCYGNTIRGNVLICNIDEGILLYRSEDNTIINNLVTSSYRNGIQLWTHSKGNNVSGNTITNCGAHGIQLNIGSTNDSNVISSNTIRNCYNGISVSGSGCNVFRHNDMIGNSYNLMVWIGNWSGNYYPYFIQDMDTSNTVDGKPVYYWVNQRDKRIPADAGFLTAVNCANISVRNLDLTKNFVGVTFVNTTGSIIENVDTSDNVCGMALLGSDGNVITRCTITSTEFLTPLSPYTAYTPGIGFIIAASKSNTIYHNNLINNTVQVYSFDTTNIWDDGYPSGGNYWSDYNGTDLRWGSGQNMTGSDGIGDTPYTINANNQDRYPLMARFTTFDTGTWNGEAYNVGVVSNSTLSDFNLSATQKTLSFTVAGGEGEAGFCRITIPNTIVQELWDKNYTVLLNGVPQPFTSWADAANTYIYLNYTHSKHQIVIIPEFPTAIILPLLMTLSMIAVVFAKRKLPKKTQTLFSLAVTHHPQFAVSGRMKFW